MDWNAIRIAASNTGSFAKGAGSGLYEGGASLIDGFKSLAQTAGKLATDEAYQEQVFAKAKELATDTADFGARAWQDPAGTSKDTWEATKALGANMRQQYIEARDAAEREGKLAAFYGKIAGRGGFEIGGMLIPVSKLGLAGKGAGALAKTSRATEGSAVAARVRKLIQKGQGKKAARVKQALEDAAALEKRAPAVEPGVIAACRKTADPELARLHAQFPDEIRNASTFVPKGVSQEEILQYLNTPDGRQYLYELRRGDPGASADKILERAFDHLSTGTTLPRQQTVTKPLLKIVPEGDNHQSFTPFWTTEEELQKAIASGKPLNEYFGLPMKSDALTYKVVKSTPREPMKVFVNEVAPTEELGKVAREGGATQYLVPNRHKDNWVDVDDAYEPLGNVGGKLQAKPGK